MYPVRYEADYVEPQNRWITGFRLILVIPWYLLGSIYAFAAFIVAFLAWFAIVFTGRYPEGLYNFNAGFLRFIARAYAFTFLQTDRWPPFGFEQAPDYPIRAEVDSPLEHYNRWKTGFRLILGIPVMFMAYLFSYLYQLASVIAWLHIVFMGRTSGGIHNALSAGLTYQLRTTAYLLLVTETLPPVSDQAPAPTLTTPAASSLAPQSTPAPDEA